MNFHDILEPINNLFYFRPDGVLDVVKSIAEILIFTYFIFVLLTLVRETRAWQLLKGILLLLLFTVVSNLLEFRILSFVLNNTFSVMAMGVLILFQPELRRGLEQIGRSSIKGMFGMKPSDAHTETTIESLVKACGELSKTYTGALIVIEKRTKIGDIINTGIPVNSDVTAALLINIFTPNTPLHDGAIVIRDNRIKAATCYLPLTESKEVDKELGTRHRAAIGMTEVSDALVIVVSEETGKISLIINGKIDRGLTPDELRTLLMEHMAAETPLPKMSFLRGKIQK